MIRIATFYDAPELYRLAVEAHSKTRYSSIEVSPEIVKRLIARLIGSRQGFVWVAQRGDEIGGVLIGAVDHILWSKEKEAHDLLFYVRDGFERDGVRLAKKFLTWGKAQPGVSMVGLSVSNELSEPGRLYERLGLRHIGGTYIEVLK